MGRGKHIPLKTQADLLLTLRELENPTPADVHAAFDLVSFPADNGHRRAWLKRAELSELADMLRLRRPVAQESDEVAKLRAEVKTLAIVIGHMRMWLQKGVDPVLPKDLAEALARIIAVRD